MYKITTVLLALLFSAYGFSQEKIYYNERDKVDSHAEATWYKIVTKDNETGITTETCYKINDDLISINEFSDYDGKIHEGKSEYYSPDGSPAFISHYKNNKFHGNRKSYYRKNALRRDENYIDGVMTDGKCFDEYGYEIPFFPAEVKPEYPGGLEKLYSDIAKDFKIRKRGVAGKIVLKFIIEKDGSVTEVSILKSVHPKLDKEAIRVMNKLPKWKPGLQEGKPVRVMYSIPIKISYD